MRIVGIWLVLGSLLIFSCEDPQAMRSDGLVENPFAVSMDTLRMDDQSIISAIDTVHWDATDIVYAGQTSDYVAGFSFTISYPDSFWNVSTLDSVYVVLTLANSFPDDPADTLEQDSAIFTFHDIQGIEFDPLSNPGPELHSSTYPIKGTRPTWHLPLDTTFLANYDTTIQIGVTAAGNGHLTAVYGVSSTYRPRITFVHSTPYLEPDSINVGDSTFIHNEWAGIMDGVMHEQPGAFDHSNFWYIKQLSGDYLGFGFHLGEWGSNVDTLRHMIRSRIALAPDTLRSKIYATSPDDSTREFVIRVKDPETDITSTIFLDADFNDKLNDIRGLLQDAVDAHADSFVVELRTGNRARKPSYLAFSKAAGSFADIEVTSSKVVAP